MNKYPSNTKGLIMTDIIPQPEPTRTSDGELWFTATTVRMRDTEYPQQYTLTDKLAPDETTVGGIKNDLDVPVSELGRSYVF
jgi:hypothetical protein